MLVLYCEAHEIQLRADGFCVKCGFYPDMQSTYLSARPTRPTMAAEKRGGAAMTTAQISDMLWDAGIAHLAGPHGTARFTVPYEQAGAALEIIMRGAHRFDITVTDLNCIAACMNGRDYARLLLLKNGKQPDVKVDK